MTADAQTTFSLSPETARWARTWVLGWAVLATLCSPTLVDGILHVGEVSQRSCLFGLIVVWLMPLASACAVYGPDLIERAFRHRDPQTREQISTGLVVTCAALSVLAVLPAIGFVVLLTVELVIWLV